MAVRGLIIAVENYPKVQVGGIAKSLPGTLQAGLDFKAWLLEKWKAEGRAENDTQLIFCSDPVQPGGVGATSNDIRRAMLKLKDQGQSATEELYFFLSGHGFSFVERPGSRADIVIASDFEDPALSGNACLNLDAIIAWLRDHLGTGRHYYFVDACRNELNASQIQIGSLLPIDPQASGEASTYVLQSTVDGAVAAANGTFSATLLAGLRGRGRAKVWQAQVNDKMFVRYDSLRSHLKGLLADKQKITSRVEGSDGESDGLLATLRPIPMSKCTIAIDDAPAPLDGELVYRRGHSRAEERQPLVNQPIVLALEPDDYTVLLRLKNEVVETATPMPLDLYEDRSLIFKRIAPGTPESTLEPIGRVPEVGAESNMDIVVPGGTMFQLDNVNTGEEAVFNTSARVKLPTGRYFGTLRNQHGHVFKRQEINLEPGQDGTLNVAEWQQSAPHVAIASKLPSYAVHDGAVDFSESLDGAITDPDLDLWLALVGGGRILGSTGDYSKLAGLPLHNFAGEQAGASPIYMLAGFEDVDTTLHVGLSRDAGVTWGTATQAPDMPGICEAYFAAALGWKLVSLRIDDQAPYTIASLASPNRGMLITLTLDDEGNPRVSQYLLPLGHLVDRLPTDMKERVKGRNHLRDVRFLAQANRAFRKRRDLRKEVPAGELTELLDAKWLDPIASTLASYEALRRGRKNELRQVVANMTRFFGDIPDTAALAKLAGEDVERPHGVPLFADGLRAFPDFAEWLPLPAGHLDFASPWTAWRAAVKS
ncbi:MAG: hypothetical protein QOG83_780 [Alphaproteobacteria bacterium]|nr:hypothetical protein [Alphaproteobacteria bacterium]